MLMDSVAVETWLVSPASALAASTPDGLVHRCGRSGEEREVWRNLDATARNTVWRDLPRRKAVLGVRFPLCCPGAAPP